jgi:diguanylate cyclase (GGDEF)-like protein
MRVLLLEDDDDLAESLAMGLSAYSAHYEFRRAGCLTNAKQLLKLEKFDVALVDLTLPDADGSEAAIALRMQSPQLPLVALTGRNFDEVALELAREGVQDYLRKGATPLSRVHEVLQLAAVRQHREDALREQAIRDPLTGAINRAHLHSELEAAIARAERTGLKGAVMLLDIDNFKSINDTYGHNAGDEVLRTVVARLRSVARKHDGVARLGGDEIVLVVEGLLDRGSAAIAARRALEATNRTCSFAAHEINVSVSIGIAMFPDQSAAGEELLELADQAMYRAKRSGKGAYAFYTPAGPEVLPSGAR